MRLPLCASRPEHFQGFYEKGALHQLPRHKRAFHLVRIEPDSVAASKNFSAMASKGGHLLTPVSFVATAPEPPRRRMILSSYCDNDSRSAANSMKPPAQESNIVHMPPELLAEARRADDEEHRPADDLVSPRRSPKTGQWWSPERVFRSFGGSSPKFCDFISSAT